MKDIKIKNKKLRDKFNSLLENYSSNLTQDHINLIKIVILRFKENSSNEYSVVLILIYGLYFFKSIDLNNGLLSKEDIENINKISNSYNYDVNGEFKKYIFEMIDFQDDLFLVKIIIKYTLLNSQDKYLKYIPNLENYFKSIGYLIPILTFRECTFLSFYQDFYFKKLYSDEYSKLKKKHLRKTSTLELPGEYIISKINALSNLMKRIDVSGTITLRKKSYFSLYAKYNRKIDEDITDSIGIRIVFDNIRDLNIFKSNFETNHLLQKKKDYINNPKENGYKAIHYSYITAFRNSQILVELQIKTKKMEKDEHAKRTLSHYTYTIKEGKWHPLFKEVYEGYEIIKEYLETRKNP